jgi:hypothetical protein
VYVSNDLGLPALRSDLAATDPASTGDYASYVRRNQVGGAIRANGSVYHFQNNETAYNGLRVRFGPNTSIDCSTFTTLFNWTSFINGEGSGPFSLGEDGAFCGRTGLRFQNDFGLSNPNYGTGSHQTYGNLPFPDRWMDVLVGVHYSTSWSGGWLELSWKWASEPVSAFRAVTFPAPGSPTRYIQRTLGDLNSINDNRFGVYTGKSQNVQEGLADFFVAPDKQTVLDAFTAIGAN